MYTDVLYHIHIFASSSRKRQKLQKITKITCNYSEKKERSMDR